MPYLEIRLFGPIQVSQDGEPVSELRSEKALALLSYLAVEWDRSHRREKLAGLLWPDFTESSARTNLRRALADLRNAIEDPQRKDPYLQSSRQTVQFNHEGDAWVDVNAFTHLLGVKTPGSPPRSLSEIKDADVEKAVALYRGPFLEGFSLPDSAGFEEWSLFTRERMQRLVRKALFQLMEKYQKEGDYGRALHHAWSLISMDPWQENAQRQLMRLLALDGRRDAALAQYEEYSRELMRELKTEPSQQTQELYRLLQEGEWPPTPQTGFAELIQEPIEKLGECPYRGLNAFREEDAPFFYGRERFTTSLQEAVEQKPLVSLIGPSGSGKSSIVFAGLLPKMREEEGWLITSCRLGSHPFQALSSALTALQKPPLRESHRLNQPQDMAAALIAGECSLPQAMDFVLDHYSQQQRLLLVIDQFEELYTLCPHPDKRRRFLDELLSAVQAEPERARPPYAILLILRADFMGQALAYRPFADTLQEGVLLLGPMRREELQEAIAQPAEKQGAVFEPGLVDRILDDVGEEPGYLPLLEFALTLLWERSDSGYLTHNTYEQLGRVEGALAGYAEGVYGDLTQDQQEKAPQIFTQLVKPGEGTEDTRRIATKAEIGEDNWPLTRLLADHRLLVMGWDASGNQTVELAHEALIQRWERLQGWLATNRAFRTWQERLRAALQQWQTSSRDEGALLRGVPLAQAEGWFVIREEELSPVEKEFIQASISLRERRQNEHEAQQQRQLAAERRARRFLGLLAGVLAVATLISVLMVNYSLKQQRQAQVAYSQSMAANAREALNDHSTLLGLSLALEANQIKDPPPESKRVLMDAAYAPGPRWLANAKALFGDGRMTCTALDIGPLGRTALLGLSDGVLIHWDIGSKKEHLRLEGHGAQINDVVFGPDGSTALSGGDDGQVIFWDLVTGEGIYRLEGHSGAVRTVDISPDGELGVSGGYAGANLIDPGELIVWDLKHGKVVHRLEGHTAGVVAARFTADGNGILSSSGDKSVYLKQKATTELVAARYDLILWDAKNKEVIWELRDLEDDVYSIDISPDGTRAITGSYDGTVSLRNLENGKRIRLFEGHQRPVSAVVFTPDGRKVLSGSLDTTLILWDINRGELLDTFEVHNGDVIDVAVNPDGRSALSVSFDGELVLSDLVDASEVRKLRGHGDLVYDVALTPDGKYALSASGGEIFGAASYDTSIRFWDLTKGEQIRMHDFPSLNAIFQVAISPDGRTALVVGTDPWVRIWDLEKWAEVSRLEGHTDWVTGVEFTPDGKKALSASMDGTLILWDISQKEIIYRMDGHGKGLWALAASPDGRTAVSDSGDSSFILWDLETGQEIRSFARPLSVGEQGSSGLAYLPDGKTVISCERDGYIIEWNLESGEEIRRLGNHPSIRTRVVISPDGRFAMTSSETDGSLMLWNLDTGELIRRSEYTDSIFDLTITPDGRNVFFGSADTNIVQWMIKNPTLEELKSWVRNNRYIPGFTCDERERYHIDPLCEDM